MILNRHDYLLMKILHEKKCNSFFFSMTLLEVAEEAEVSKSTVYRSFLKLYQNGFVQKGCLSEKAETYYLTEKGIKTVKNGGIEEC